jgi:tetratricopeptide (TPR) repeat protein
MSYSFLAGCHRLFVPIVVGSSIVVAATVAFALPPDLESQVRSGNITRQEAEQLNHMSGGTTKSPAPTTASTSNQSVARQPQELQPRPKVNEQALLDRATQLLDDYAGDSRQLEEANNYLQQILAANPRNALAYSELARFAYKSGGTDPRALQFAHTALNKALSINPRLFEAFIVSAHIADLEGDLGKMKKWTAEAEKIRPGDPDVAVKYVQIALKENNYDAIIVQTKRALAKPPTRNSKAVRKILYAAMITAYSYKRDLNGTKQAYLSAIASDPTDPTWKQAYQEFLDCACQKTNPKTP